MGNRKRRLKGYDKTISVDADRAIGSPYSGDPERKFTASDLKRARAYGASRIP
jgi:hypothetical protein